MNEVEEDKRIRRLIVQISEYEQELYDKDIYIEKLENELRQNLIAFDFKGEIT
jgi:hypothetical protein